MRSTYFISPKSRFNDTGADASCHRLNCNTAALVFDRRAEIDKYIESCMRRSRAGRC